MLSINTRICYVNTKNINSKTNSNVLCETKVLMNTKNYTHIQIAFTHYIEKFD